MLVQAWLAGQRESLFPFAIPEAVVFDFYRDEDHAWTLSSTNKRAHREQVSSLPASIASTIDARPEERVNGVHGDHQSDFTGWGAIQPRTDRSQGKEESKCASCLMVPNGKQRVQPDCTLGEG
jgi:hypothetical protein